MTNGRLRFLVDERDAKEKLLSTKVGQEMTPEQRNERLMPYQQTSILKEQMLNLIESNDGINTILKPNNKSIKHDKFSAFIYGLLCIKREEEQKKRKKGSLRDLMFFS